MFHFLLYVAKGSSSLNIREKRTILNRISNLARVNLTRMLGAPTSHSQATVCFSFWFMDMVTLLDYSEPDPLCSRSCCNINLKIPISTREWEGGMSICRADQLLGLPRTIFTACGLTTATTHCGLIKFINTDGLQQICP